MTTTPIGRPARPGTRWRRAATVAVVLAVVAGCGGTSNGDGAAGEQDRSLTLYTCLNDTSIQPVINAFEKTGDGQVDLFRAPTGEINARVAADVRSGGLRADVVWGCDPLTMQAFVDQHLVGGWLPPEADAIPAEYRTDDYVGAHLLYLVAVHRTTVPAPASWSDLAGPAYDAVAVPDPSVAASALGALGWFAGQPAYGVEFYRHLRDGGAVQVKTPDDVTTGVAQGLYDAGMTTANSAYAAKDDGSPVDVVWPEPGAIAIYGPIALCSDSADSAAAKSFISFVVGEEGQAVLGASGSYPTLPGAAGPTIPASAPVVAPDWSAVGAEKDAFLADYQQVFGG
jgi:iron(III) transport system substrate-binding protein